MAAWDDGDDGGIDTNIFDDKAQVSYAGGQRLWSDTYGTVFANFGTDGIVMNRASATYSPQAVNPNATSWDDVLKYGLARTIDAKVRPVRPENTIPVLARNQFDMQQQSQQSMMVWLLVIGGVVFLAFSK